MTYNYLYYINISTHIVFLQNKRSPGQSSMILKPIKRRWGQVKQSHEQLKLSGLRKIDLSVNKFYTFIACW